MLLTKLDGDVFMFKTGRVHLATVKSADSVKYAVMVEWNERNMFRGKEVSKPRKHRMCNNVNPSEYLENNPLDVQIKKVILYNDIYNLIIDLQGRI